jgi:hypothetical protein
MKYIAESPNVWNRRKIRKLFYTQKKKLHGLSPRANYTERPPLVGEVIATFYG